MKEFRYVIKDSVGIHARPAGMLVKTAGAFQSFITVKKGRKNSRRKKAIFHHESWCQMPGSDSFYH